MEVEEINIENKYYPESLKKIKNAPQKLYVLGNKEILNTKGIAIIGSRDCTEEGAKNAQIFSANIAKTGLTIISGMAKGIDAKAHIGALEVGRKDNRSFRKWSKIHISKRKRKHIQTNIKKRRSNNKRIPRRYTARIRDV